MHAVHYARGTTIVVSAVRVSLPFGFCCVYSPAELRKEHKAFMSHLKCAVCFFAGAKKLICAERD